MQRQLYVYVCDLLTTCSVLTARSVVTMTVNRTTIIRSCVKQAPSSTMFQYSPVDLAQFWTFLTKSSSR